jgi:serine phosphatase RsbU (regulator of sigma subunit)/anti-sigma regulatory factor (Ser/Thr protein kinase)
LRGIEGHVERLLRRLTAAQGYANLSKSLLRDLKLAAIEGVTNACQHGRSGRKPSVGVVLRADPRRIEITVEDRGKGFKLAAALRRRPGAESVRGRGLWIMKSLVDGVYYRRGRPNRLVLIRKLNRPRSLDAAMDLFDRLHEAIQALQPVEYLYEEFLDFVVDLFNVRRASFLLFDRRRKVLRVATSRGIPAKVAAKIAIAPGKEISGYVFRTGRPLLVQNLTAMKRGAPRPRGSGYATKSFVSVPVVASPLHLGEETVGVLNLTDKRDGGRFTRSELKLINLMASQAASAFRIRNLIDAVKVHESLDKEFEIVGKIQDRLIPQRFPSFPGLEIGGKFQLSQRGGGDYYDVLKVDDVLRGVIADVSGHNVGSAITMASFRSVFRSLVFDPNTPGKLLQVLRWVMHDELIQLHQFISVWIFEYEASGTLKMSGAGHPPIMIYRPKTRQWVSHYSSHLPLGLEDESRVQNLKIRLARGDMVFFYTDGLFDPRMRATGFDRQRVLELIERHSRQSPRKLVKKIFEELSPHQALLHAPDDVAVLALRRK